MATSDGYGTSLSPRIRFGRIGLSLTYSTQAWNLRPRKHSRKWQPSSEFVESALILFYGGTNIFLEHLGGAGGPWSAQDLEHVSITVLFIGGGLVSRR
ncbi:hypothetical protein IMZ48_25000 [Candidatus Bathyarchaeota archaeon]|nr:hypothetical protein [Candidatus Bathyarchaeota archaeon]